MRRTLLLAAVTLITPLVLAVASAAGGPCEDLKTTLTLPYTTITLAESHAAGPFTPPGAAPVVVPAFCRVAGAIKPTSDSNILFEVWMPTASWNGKFEGVGNGGLAGTISYGAMAAALNRNYATASTDTGHRVTNPDGLWALGHPELIIDFAHRATHEMTVKGQAITHAFYGTGPRLSYFVGCSKGGQQALMEAQRYPDDYDGIIGGDPANFWTHHYLGGHLWPSLAILRDTTLAHYIPATKIPAIANAVNAQCDALDGVVDGILGDPRRCHFDPSTLLCQAGDAPTCLTAPQVEALEQIYDGPGKRIYPGILPGAEAGPGGWAAWITGTTPGVSLHLTLGIPFFKYFIFDDPNWDFHTLNFTTDVKFTDTKSVAGEPMASVINAVDPNLRPFRERGGKLIHYHGFSDPDITPINSINYYESVVAQMRRGHRDRDDGHGKGKSLEETTEFYRLFMVPGMQHCAGGPGTDQFDALTALERWVEQGIAPDRIIASHVEKGVVTMQRPLCPFPEEAVYTGQGSTNDAANFVCRVVEEHDND